MPEPWDRLPQETAKAFDAFAAYREMGVERSAASVGTVLGKSNGLMERWSTRHRWVDRARAFDGRADQARQGSYLDEISKMAERHAGYAQLGLQALMAPIRELMQRIADNRYDFTVLGDAELLTVTRLAATALGSVANLERLTRGLPTERAGGEEDVAAEIAGAREQLRAIVDRIAEARERKAVEA